MAPPSVWSWRTFDDLLRGRLTAEQRNRLVVTWMAWQVACGAVYGASLGVFTFTQSGDPRFALAAAIKVPALLLLTAGVTLPSLYVFGTLRGLRFFAREFAAMLLVAHTVLAAVLASLAPVVAFFALTTTSYSFMVVLVVFTCAMAGTVGVGNFFRSLADPDPAAGPLPVGATREASLIARPGGELTVSEGAPIPAGAGPDPDPDADRVGGGHLVPSGGVPVVAAGARPPADARRPWSVLLWWTALYVFVGAQSSWILRPFLGHPDHPFALFREKGGGFVSALLDHLGRVLRGG